MMDMLEKAKHHFTESSENGYQHDAMLAQAAAAIALVERMDTQNEHLDAIRNHLDDIASVLLNAEGADGALKVYTPGEES